MHEIRTWLIKDLARVRAHVWRRRRQKGQASAASAAMRLKHGWHTEWWQGKVTGSYSSPRHTPHPWLAATDILRALDADWLVFSSTLAPLSLA